MIVIGQSRSEPLQDGYSIYCDYLFIRNSLFMPSFNIPPENMERWQLTKCKRSNYTNNKLYIMFEHLACLIDNSKNIPFLLAQFIECGLGANLPDIVNNEKHCFGEYYKLIRRVSNLKENYIDDLRKIKSQLGTWESAFDANESSYYPPIFKMYMNKDIRPESFALLSRLFCLYPIINERLNDDLLYSTEIRKIRRYCDFLSVTNHQVVSITPKSLDNVI